MHGICKGSIKPGKGKPSREVACEFVGRKPGGKRRR